VTTLAAIVLVLCCVRITSIRVMNLDSRGVVHKSRDNNNNNNNIIIMRCYNEVDDDDDSESAHLQHGKLIGIPTYVY